MNHPLMRHFRASRMRWLHATFRLRAETRVLDIGGTLYNWNVAPVIPRLTLLNMGPRPKDLPASVDYIQGDATDLSAIDANAYDLVYSNSVIEHLYDFAHQQRMAAEIRRVGRSYFVQTPDIRFPVEPHLMAPFVHWLPRSLQRPLAHYGSQWGWKARAAAQRGLTRAELDARLDELRLLSVGEMRRLFPGATIHVERFAGWPKSIIAHHKA